MKRHFSIKLTSFILSFSLLSSAFGVAASGNPNKFDEQISSQILSSLSARLSSELKAELADNSVVVQISDVKKTQATNNLIDLNGKAFCVSTDNNARLPISFEVTVNAQTQAVDEVNYKFIEDENPQFAPSSTEEVLMKELMVKVSKDYKTSSIVLAINGFEIISATQGRQFAGTGEIKIGEVEWSKINFDVVLNDDNSATKIEYRIE